MGNYGERYAPEYHDHYDYADKYHHHNDYADINHDHYNHYESMNDLWEYARELERRVIQLEDKINGAT